MSTARSTSNSISRTVKPMLSLAWMQQCNYDAPAALSLSLSLSLFSLFVGSSLPFVVRIASGHVVALIFPVRYSSADAADIISTNDALVRCMSNRRRSRGLIHLFHAPRGAICNFSAWRKPRLSDSLRYAARDILRPLHEQRATSFSLNIASFLSCAFILA